MADKTSQDEIQPLLVTKRMLGMAEKDPMPCAFALTKDKKECVLFVGKTGKASKAGTALKTDGKAFVDPQTMRFGYVQITKDDPGTVNFRVNRSEAGGTIMHMVKLVKKAGYQGLVINADGSLEKENDDDTSDAPAASAAGPASPPPAPPIPPAPPGPQAAPVDTKALKDRLTALVQRMMTVIAADPSRKDALLSIAKRAQLMLGTNNIQTATQNIDELELALGAPGANGAPATNGAAKAVDPAALAKIGSIWKATGERVRADILKLRGKLVEQYASGPSGTAISDAYDKRVATLLGAFDGELNGKLDEASKAADPAARQAPLEAAREMIDKYKALVEGDPLVGDLDDNPFVKLSIRATMGTTLTALASAVH